MHYSIIVVGEIRICKSKTYFKKRTRVEVSMRNLDRINCTVLDGCAILWYIAWPTSSPMNQALVKDYVESFKQYLQQHLTSGDVYLIFDRYIEFSAKYSALKARGPAEKRRDQKNALIFLGPASSQHYNSGGGGVHRKKKSTRFLYG